MASPVDTSVKHFLSSSPGAPVLSGTAGSLVALLDAVLVNGYGIKSVTTATVTDGVCRLNFSSGASAATLHSVVLVAGAGTSALNGEQKVTAVTDSYVEFATGVVNGSVSGTITFKMAPLGWAKVYGSATDAAYQQLDPLSTRSYLRVTDTNATYARVQTYEAMTAINAGTAVSPTTPAGGFYWYKRTDPTTEGCFWTIVGDSRSFYLFNVSWTGGTPTDSRDYAGLTASFGDVNSYRSGDVWGSLLTGAASTYLHAIEGCVFQTTGTTGLSLKRAYHGIGNAVPAGRRVFGNNLLASGMDDSFGTFPAQVDQSLRLSPIVICEPSAAPRGEMPGAYHCPQSKAVDSFGTKNSLTVGNGALSGRTLLSVHVGSPSVQRQGVAFFDITGPWRA